MSGLKPTLYSVAIGLLFLGLQANAESARTVWKSVMVKNQVEVFNSKMAGSSFLAFKAVTFMDAKVEIILAAIADHGAYPDWYYNCKETELIEWHEHGEAVVRIVIKTPFPLANRDAINLVTVRQQSDAALVRLTSRPRYVPEVDGLVRMSIASGSWLLEPGRGGTLVTHIYHADPKVKVPAWMMNRFVVHGPVKTLTNLRRLVEN